MSKEVTVEELRQRLGEIIAEVGAEDRDYELKKHGL
jgi:antitoxin (DNA-binding transcriptional repressor) of toxin-antitoxin stability system